uniref:Putative secreted protein n=1 Tax=Panstrongylus lignarius TaxID=156445 RepID=A0A224XL45_9HEMI
MKYFSILIWILLQLGISSLPQAKRIYFLHNNLGKINKNQIFVNISAFEEDNEALNEPIPDIEMILKRNAETTVSSIDAIKDILSKGDLSKLPATFYYYPMTTKATCPVGPKAPTYNNVECTYVPGKIICHMGRFNFVINNGDHHMDRDVVEKFVIMAYQRYGEGDNFFDVAVDEKETTPCGCYIKDSFETTENINKWNLPPVTIECELVSNDKIKMCNPLLEPTEKIYQCKTKTLGLRKRSTLHISVNNDGIVSFVKDPMVLHQKVRKKREFSWSLPEESENFQNKKLREKSRRFAKYNDEESVTDENDLSNLYFHSKIPYVRNYTDTCTLQYQFYPWCPEYKTDPCSSPISAPTPRPCRQACATKCTTQCTTAPQCIVDTSCNTTPLCTVEVTTDEILLRQTKKHAIRKKRHKKNGRRRRKLQKPPKFDCESLEVAYSNTEGKNLNAIRRGRQYLSDLNSADDTPQNILQANFQGGCPRSTTCSTPARCRTSGPCNSNSCILASKELKIQQSDQQAEMLKENSLHQLKEENARETLQYFGTENSLVQSITNQSLRQIERLDEENTFPQISQPPQSGQILSNNNFELENTFPKAEFRSDYYVRSPQDNYLTDESLNNDLSGNLIRPFKKQYRPKRKMIFRKIPRFRRKQMKQWMYNQVNAPPSMVNV